MDSLKVRIRELEKEVERWKSQVKNVRYGLNWMDVPEAFDKDSEDKIPILEEVAEKSVDAEGPLAGRPSHMIIEGDNYHALTCLNYTHRGKIDVIYIDPPYNTGSDGFTYKDKRFLTEFPDGQKVPKEHPLRHSYWLSFMEKRLKLAKNLLRDKGVIFISIDDNEQANLKLLCDKVFGEGNFIADVIWNSRKSVSNDAVVSLNHNYTLIYTKNITQFNKYKSDFKLVDEGVGFSNPDNDSRGLWKADPFDSPGIRPNLTYPIKNPITGVEYLPPEGRCWRTGKNEYEMFLADNRIVFGKTGKSKPQLKRFLSEAQEKGLTPKSIWDDCGTATNGTQEIQEIFGEKIFDTPKPTALLQRIIQISTSTRDSLPSTVLDFFAGSGTTLHATLNLNKEDDGNRQCILVQQAEGDNNICENVTYERNRRVMCGYTNAKGENVEGLGGSLKYYKTGFVGKHQSKN
ncbi:MAG: site-specific DNA-methyltransferase, partial [Bacteroidales bacterium]|nr:site-specific DNA-methyltransferase [Bacteroidales bacterium]